MTRLTWGEIDKRYFEAGLDRGVLYPNSGPAVPWDGLISVDETGGEAARVYYLDGRPTLYLPLPKEYEATLEAYTYPDEFADIMGLGEHDDLDGFYLDSQMGDTFGLSYRTKVGNATEGIDHAYKIHVVYNASVSAPGSNYQSLSQEINPSTFSWQINASPMAFEGHRPTAHVVIDTRKMSAEQVAEIETILYGDATTAPSLPDPFELFEIIRFGDAVIITDNGDGTWTAEGASENVFMVDAKIFQVNNVDRVDNGDGTFEISAPGLDSAQTITLAEAERIEDTSIVDVELENGYLFLTAKSGVQYNAGRVGEPALSDDLSPSVMVTLPATLETVQRNVVIPDWHQPSDAATKLPNPGVLPGAGTQIASVWSPDGIYLALLQSSAVEWYKRSRDTFTKLLSPTAPAGTPSNAAWSPDGQYLAVSHTSGSPFITIYKRSGDTLTKLGNPAVIPTSGARSVSWSPDGLYLAVALAVSPYVMIYKRAGDIFTKLADPAGLPTTDTYDVSFAPNGLYLAVASQGAPFIQVFSRTADVFTLIPSLGVAIESRSVAWSPSGKYLAVGFNAAPWVAIYKREGTTFTRLTMPASNLGNSVNRLVWSPDEKYLVAYSVVNAFFEIENETVSRIRDLVANPVNGSTGFDWSPDGLYLTFVHATSPYLSIFKAVPQVSPGGTLTLEIAT